MDPFDEASSRSGDAEQSKKFEALRVDPHATIKSQQLLVRAHRQQLVIGVVTFLLGCVAAGLLGWAAADLVPAMQFTIKGVTFSGPISGGVLVLGTVLAILIVRQDVRHKHS